MLEDRPLIDTIFSDAASCISGRIFEFDDVLVNSLTYRRAMMAAIAYARATPPQSKVETIDNRSDTETVRALEYGGSKESQPPEKDTPDDSVTTPREINRDSLASHHSNLSCRTWSCSRFINLGNISLQLPPETWSTCSLAIRTINPQLISGGNPF